MKLAMSQIKLFILKFLLNYNVLLPSEETLDINSTKPFDSIETKDPAYSDD